MSEADNTLDWLYKIGAEFHSDELSKKLEAAGYTRTSTSISDNGYILVVFHHQKEGAKDILSYYCT